MKPRLGGKTAGWRSGAARMRRIVPPAIAGFALVAAQAVAAADFGRGGQLAATCAACHGVSGGAQGIPILTGMEAEKIIGAMLAYRESERPSHVMHAVALSLSDEEIASVARYLAAQGEGAEAE